MFFKKKGYELTLNRVHDTIRINENGETLDLTVNGDPMRMVAGLNAAQKKLVELADNKDASPEAMHEAAEFFAAVIFGKEQTEKLFAFYADDPGCVITACGTYFKERLANKIAAQQKKMKA
jgi:hypothetical protein